MIKFSAPGKIHLLGEHSVVYGKPALLAAVDLRVSVILTSNVHPTRGLVAQRGGHSLKKIIEPIVKKHLKLKTIPPYQLTISSQLPIGAGLGSSAAISASYIAALLTFLKIKWDLNLINQLTYEAEKVFHGNPSGADNSTVVFGGLIWFSRTNFEKLNLNGLGKLTKNFVLINTGTPEQTTKQMVEIAKAKVKKILDEQEQLTKELLNVIKIGNQSEMIRIIQAGEKNLESIGVVSKQVAAIIRKVEKIGGAAKISGGGGATGPTGVLLCYHLIPSKLIQIAKSYKLDYYKTSLGVGGLRKE